jgi:hypothetical protein
METPEIIFNGVGHTVFVVLQNRVPVHSMVVEGNHSLHGTWAERKLMTGNSTREFHKTPTPSVAVLRDENHFAECDATAADTTCVRLGELESLGVKLGGKIITGVLAVDTAGFRRAIETPRPNGRLDGFRAVKVLAGWREGAFLFKTVKIQGGSRTLRHSFWTWLNVMGCCMWALAAALVGVTPINGQIDATFLVRKFLVLWPFAFFL